MKSSIIRDINLASNGHKKIQWVKNHMPVLNHIEREFERTKPLAGKRITISIHLEAKTAYLAKVLQSAGAIVSVTGSNPLSTQDDIAAALVKDGLFVNALYGATDKEYYEHLNNALSIEPHVIVDDGGDLVHMIHEEKRELIKNIIGGSEETTTGVMRLKSRELAGKLSFPMIAVNDALSKYLFDNRYGTGQSVWDGITRTTNLIVAGKTVVVIGYGWCGKGVALRAKGLGSNVVICEIDPIKALEAYMDGFKVMPMDDAAHIGDFFITVTGCEKVITKKHFQNMKNGAILSNAGHFDVEIWKPDLDQISVGKTEARKNIIGYLLEDGRTIYLLAEGRLVNLAAGDGHPAEIMDMSFALQALSVDYLCNEAGHLENKVYSVPKKIDQNVSVMKLSMLGIEIDKLTDEQDKYLKGFSV